MSVIVEVTPELAGVAEAAAILGWDRRRVITYVDRGSFPQPVARLASGRVWRREDVEAFARAWNRRRARRVR
jgi:predicted DNA-binding transcriptional regulator AlpA